MPRPHRRTVGHFAATGVATVLAAAGSGTAHADEPDNVNVVPPVMAISMAEITGATRVCATGSAQAPGSWSVGVNGLRSTGTQVSYTAGSAPITSFRVCTDVPKAAAPAGAFYVSFVFHGGSTPSVTVRPGSLSGITAWSPFGDDVHVQTTGG